MAMLALFVSLASAQVVVGTVGTGSAGPLSCTANVSVPPQLRSEGMTELIGDIVLSCTGGSPVAPGLAIPTVNITVSLATNVTSRLLGTGSVTNASEALLLIDEPGSGLTSAVTGTGPGAAIALCPTPGFGAGPGGTCAQVASASTAITAPGGGTTVTPVAAAGSTFANTFQGLVTANQVTFLGIPVLPPSTTGIARVFRITNIRGNVSALGGGGLPGTTQLLASIAISGSSSLPVLNPVQVAGFIQSGLTASLRNAANSAVGGSTNLAQCGGGGPSPLQVVRFAENFATAFKTRVGPTATTGGRLPRQRPLKVLRAQSTALSQIWSLPV